jgi:hypothetical protein
MKNRLSKIALALLLIMCAWYGKNLDSWGRNKVINHDVISYYAYLPAAFIFHDFNFHFIKDVAPDYEVRVWYSTAQNGKPVLRMTMGLAVLWLPFFLPAHLLAHIIGASPLGYSWPYSFSIFLAALFYLLAGLVFLRKILLDYFPDWITALTLVVVVAATNLQYYVISEPGMSHVYNFALITGFFYFTLKWTQKPTIRKSITLGVLAGLIILVRPVNGLVLILPALAGIHSFSDVKGRITGYWKHIAIASLSAFLLFVPQILYWKIQAGHFFFNSYMDSGRFYFLSPHITAGILGFRKGWLVYTPVMAFALAGFFVLHKKAKGLCSAILPFFILFVYFIFSWWCWWYGGSYGSRPMIDIYGILALPLAACLGFLFSRKAIVMIISGLLLVVFLGLNQYQMTQYRTSLLHWDSMTGEAYRAIFLKKDPPADYEKMLRKPDYEKALKGEKESK